MCVGQITHVDVVPDTCPVRCIVVVAEDRQLRPCARGRLEGNGNEVRLRAVILTAVGGRSGGVEVAQRDVVESGRERLPCQHALEDALGVSVHVDGLGPRCLDDGHRLGLSVDPGGRREDDLRDTDG